MRPHVRRQVGVFRRSLSLACSFTALLESNSEGGVSDGGRKEEEEPDVEPGGSGDGGQRRAASPQLDLPVQCPTSVACPICQRSFPMTEIEVHAAYCDEEEMAAARRPRPDCQQGQKSWTLLDLYLLGFRFQTFSSLSKPH